MKEIRPIRTQADLDWALGEIEPYFDAPPAPGSEEADRFDILSDLIEAYENRTVTVAAADPIDILTFFMKTTVEHSPIWRMFSARARGLLKSCGASAR